MPLGGLFASAAKAALAQKKAADAAAAIEDGDGGQVLESVAAALRERQEKAERSMHDGIGHARSMLLETALPPPDSLELQPPTDPLVLERAVRAIIDELTLCANSAMRELGNAEADFSREKLKAQQHWWGAKLETQRVGALVRMEQRAVEVQATCARQFDEKMKKLASEGGLENSLLERVEEQNKELARLEGCENELQDAKEQIAALEAENANQVKTFAQLREDVRICQNVMRKSAKQDLGVEMQAGKEEEHLREAVQEVIAVYSEVSKTSVEAIAALNAEKEALVTSGEESEVARAAAEEETVRVRGQLEASMEAGSAAFSKIDELELEVQEKQGQLDEIASAQEVRDRMLRSLSVLHCGPRLFSERLSLSLPLSLSLLPLLELCRA